MTHYNYKLCNRTLSIRNATPEILSYHHAKSSLSGVSSLTALMNSAIGKINYVAVLI